MGLSLHERYQAFCISVTDSALFPASLFLKRGLGQNLKNGDDGVGVMHSHHGWGQGRFCGRLRNSQKSEEFSEGYVSYQQWNELSPNSNLSAQR